MHLNRKFSDMTGLLEIDILDTKQETEASEGEGSIPDLSNALLKSTKMETRLGKSPEQAKPCQLCEQNHHLALYLEG